MTTKKIGASTIALIVVSVLLIMSLTVTATLAWFMDSDSASSPEIIMGEQVLLSINRDAVTGGVTGKSADNFDIIMFADQLVPGMKVSPNLRVDFAKSSTPAILRTQLKITVTGGVGIDANDRKQLENNIIQAIEAKLTDEWFYYDSDGDDAEPGFYYYIGTAGSANTYVMARTQENVVANPALTGTEIDLPTSNSQAKYVAPYARKSGATGSTPLASVYTGNIATGATAPIYLFNPVGANGQYIRIPSSLTNKYAGAKITITFNAEAIQDFLLDTGDDDSIIPTANHFVRIAGKIITSVPTP